DAALALLAGLERGGRRLETRLVAGHEGDALLTEDRLGYLLAVQFLKLWLGVEQINMRRPAGHEEIDDALDLGREVRRGRGFLVEKRCQRRNAEPGRRSLEETAAMHDVASGIKRVNHHTHSRFFSSSGENAFSARLKGAAFSSFARQCLVKIEDEVRQPRPGRMFRGIELSGP